MTEEVGVAGFIDVETTGLDPLEHEVVEFSMAIFRFNRETGEILETIDEYTGQREPGRSIPRAASEIHGLTKRNLKGKALDQGHIDELAEMCEFLIAHNAQFDRNFVHMNKFYWYCSMRGINWKGHGYKSMALQKLLKGHDIDPGDAHRAGSDVRAAIELLSRKSKSDVYYFKELLDHGPSYEPFAHFPATREVAASRDPRVIVSTHYEETIIPGLTLRLESYQRAPVHDMAERAPLDTPPQSLSSDEASTISPATVTHDEPLTERAHPSIADIVMPLGHQDDAGQAKDEKHSWEPPAWKIDGVGKIFLIIMLGLLFIMVLSEYM